MELDDRDADRHDHGSESPSTLFRGVHRGALVEVEVRWRGRRAEVGAVLVDGEPVASCERSTAGREIILKVVPQKRSDVGDGEGDEAEEGAEARSMRIRIIPRTLGRSAEAHIETEYRGVGTVLVPEDGSSSAARDERMVRSPWRFALVRGLIAAAKVLVPLLGLRIWLDRATQPAQDAAEEAVRPAIEAISPVLDAIGAFIGAVADVLGSILGFLFGWIPPLVGFLFGWLPDGGFEVVVAVLTVLGTTLAARATVSRRGRGLQRSREQLAELEGEGSGARQRADLHRRLDLLLRRRIAQLQDPQPPGPGGPVVGGLH